MSAHDLDKLEILVIEDGDEYLENLGRFVPGPHYIQARSAAAAAKVLEAQPVDLIYLDMRFDRIPLNDLEGDHAAATEAHNGDPARAWRYLQNNQGLFILDLLHRRGYSTIPVILAYDFSREQRRVAFLKQKFPRLYWVGDAVTPEQIEAKILAAISRA